MRLWSLRGCEHGTNARGKGVKKAENLRTYYVHGPLDCKSNPRWVKAARISSVVLREHCRARVRWYKKFNASPKIVRICSDQT